MMQPLKAHVHNGRLVLDEPTDLPEGEVVELVPVDEVLASGGTTSTTRNGRDCTSRSREASKT